LPSTAARFQAATNAAIRQAGSDMRENPATWLRNTLEEDPWRRLKALPRLGFGAVRGRHGQPMPGWRRGDIA